MKFSCSSTDLQRVLGNVGGVIPSKSTLPILENFLFQLSKNQLKITSTDLDTSMTVSLNVTGKEDGEIAIPAKRLFETVRALPNLEIEFSANTDTNKIIMKTSGGEYKLTGESSENFPSIPVFKGKEEVEVENDALRRLITKTIFAVSNDELRPAMTGILLQVRKSEIRAVATDGHRLVRLINSNFSTADFEREIIIPVKALNLISKTANNPKCTIALNENHVMFSFPDTVLISRLIEEKYPSYESVIPLDNEKLLVVNKTQLLNSIRRISLYASSTTHQIRFSVKRSNISVSAEDIDVGSEANESFTCDYGAEPLEIGFNSAYVIDILSHIDTDEVIFKMSSPTRACIIQPFTQKDSENLLMLVMPVRLNA
ncbi:MAG: DNA polymerase III subunit beta [Ignavibacteriales bacterium]|nr:DNA polymerase III subunit beta [Ignavibacteriales bacterium]